MHWKLWVHYAAWFSLPFPHKYIRALLLFSSRFPYLCCPSYVHLYVSFTPHTHVLARSKPLPPCTDLLLHVCVQRDPKPMGGGFDIKLPKQELCFMTWHSSFYAFLAFSLEKNPFMAVLCCIIISYPTHWHTIGWSSAVKLYCDWKSGVRRDRLIHLWFFSLCRFYHLWALVCSL